MNTAVPARSVRAFDVHGPHLKLALLLGVAGALATLALLPYVTALLPPSATARLSLWALVAAPPLESGVLCWLAAWLGLLLGARYGLDAPWLRAWVYRRALPDRAQTHWAAAAAIGVLAGLLVIGLDLTAGAPSALSPKLSAMEWVWRGLLASFYGGIAEETLCRLLLVSLLVWLLAKLRHGRAGNWVFVTAIVLAALLFGAGHLPNAFAAHLLHGPWSVARVVLLNGVAAVFFGAVFWRWGLEHAMLAHFAADLVLHVALPLIVPGG